MIRYYKKTKNQLAELPEREPLCWINISPPFTHEELELLAQDLEVPIEFFTDSLDVNERPRYEIEDDHKLIVLKTAVHSDDEGEHALFVTVPIGIILTPQNVITITSHESPVIDAFLLDKVKGFQTTDFQRFILQLMDRNATHFLNSLQELNAHRLRLERELYDSMRNEEIKNLLSIEKSLVFFVTSLRSNELVMLKMERTNLLGVKGDEDLMDVLESALIDTSQALEMANTYTNILSGTMDAYASIISNNLNIVIQRLTIITIMLMVPNLVFSFFGMNLTMGIEQQHGVIWPVLGLSLIATLSLLWFFRSRKLF